MFKPVDKAALGKQLRALEASGSYEAAAYAALTDEQTLRAIGIFARGSMYADAANIAEGIGRNALSLKMLVRAHQYNKGFTAACRLGLGCEAGIIAERGIRYYESVGRLKDAAELSIATGGMVRAISLYRRALDYVNAARTASKSGMERELQRIAAEGITFYTNSGRCWDAARLAEAAGMNGEAVRLYAESTDYCAALRLAEGTVLAGPLAAEASLLLGNSGRYSEAGEFALAARFERQKGIARLLRE